MIVLFDFSFSSVSITALKFLINLSSVKDFNRDKIEKINKITEEYERDSYGDIKIGDDGYKILKWKTKVRDKNKYILDNRMRTPINIYNFIKASI